MNRLLLALAPFVLPSAASAADRTFMVGSFDRVRIDGPFEVHLDTGKSPGARANGTDQRALDALSIRVNGQTLVVSLGTDTWSSRSGKALSAPVITLTTPSLRAAAVNAGGHLTIAKMSAQQIDLTVTGTGVLTVGAAQTDQFNATVIGTGSLTAAGKAGRARFQMSGPGTIEATGLIVSDLTARIDGSGEAHLAARNTAQITRLGLGRVTVAGNPSCTVNAQAGGPVICGKQD